jgi:hypothetical protein
MTLHGGELQPKLQLRCVTYCFQGRFRLVNYLALPRLTSIWMNCEQP